MNMASSSNPNNNNDSDPMPPPWRRSISDEVATFSRLASQSGSSDDSVDNNSIISLHDDFCDEVDLMLDADNTMRRGSVEYCDIRGCATGSTGASSECLEGSTHSEHSDVLDAEAESSSLLVSHADEGQYAHGESGITTISEEDDNMMRGPASCQHIMSRARSNPALSLVATTIIGICAVYILTSQQFHKMNILRTTNYIRSKTHQVGTKMRQKQHENITYKLHPRPVQIVQYPPFPAKELLGIAVNTASKESVIDPPYDPSDFLYQNKAGRNRILNYWEDVVAAIEESSDTSSVDTTPWANITSWGPCFPRALPIPDGQNRTLLRKKKKEQFISQNWTYIVQNNGINSNDEKIHYPTYKHSYSKMREADIGGLCRPGFLIIGQGKCGTSSLYHYLTGHDRVLPAVQKQIHYFIFNINKSLKWYYSNFPTIESFLGGGALMTGEASPGYMPYPSVIELLVKRMSPTQERTTDGLEAYKDSIRSLPKILTVVRDPVERAVSSYKYNYIVPALKKLKKGLGVTASGKQIPGGRTEQYYMKYLYTFEELASAELATLKECLEPGGRGETFTYLQLGKKSDMFFFDTFQSRADSSDTPLIHMDGACYVATNSRSVPRKQWNELAARVPDKILDIPNLQLTQSIIGRGIYVLPLEWWYTVFGSNSGQREDWIHVVCTEEMADNPIDTMDDVTRFLGLPEFDFENVTSEGWYNVGGHRGYDTVTTVDEVSEETNEASVATSTSSSSRDDLTSISDELLTELMDFYRPYNERLFTLIGKRCAWKE